MILATRDGGTTWTSQSVPAVAQLDGVAFASTTTGWAVGGTFGTGVVLGTADGGNTWTTQKTVTGSGALWDVASAGSSNAWAVGYQVMLATTNGGVTWASQVIPASVGSLTGVVFASTSVGWAVGLTSGMCFPCPGAIIATTNGGTTWTAQTVPAAVQNLESVAAVSATTAWASGEDCTATPCAGVLLETTNGGATWTRAMIPSGMGSLRQVVFTDATHGWAIGDKCTTTCSGAGVLVTTNGGASWTEYDLPAFPTALYRGLAFVTSSQGWASATPDVDGPGSYTGGGTVAMTTNGGTSWSPQTLATVQTSAFDVAVSDASTAWVSGQTCFAFGSPCKTAIRATTNAGGTWAAQATAPAWGVGPLTGISFVNSLSGWAVGAGPPAILATTNGGATWASQPVPAGVASLYDVTFVSATVGWAVGSCSGPMCAGTILATTDGGMTWTPQTVPADVTVVNDVFFMNSTTGWALSQNCNLFPCQASILSTTNGGANWTETAVTGLGIPEDVVFVSATTGWLVGQTNVGLGSGVILTTTDGGAIWTPQSTLTGYGVLYGVDFANTSDGWAVGRSTSGSATVATVLRTIDGGMTWNPATVPGQLGSTDDGDLYAVKFADASNGWAVGAIADQAVILHTVDGGVTWYQQPGLGPPSNVAALPGDREATITWTPPASPSPITSYTVTVSPGGATTTVSVVVPAATVTGLMNGTPYTFTVAANTAAGTGPPSQAPPPVTPTPVVQGSAVAVLPAMSNQAYGGYLTTTYVENVGMAVAHIRIQYRDQSGTVVGIGNSAAGLAVGATWTVRTDNGDSLAAGQAGSAEVFSDQPLASFVNEFAPAGSDATSYTGITVPSGAAPTVFAPAIANNAYGGFTTGIGLINAGPSATDVTITYRDATGMTVKAQTLTAVQPGAYQGLYSGDVMLGLPSGFAGTATIASSVGLLAAIVNETGPGGQFSSYDAMPSGSTTLYAPAALNNAYGGYFTGMGIQNTTAGAGTVNITYYDSMGSVVATTMHAIAANGYLGVYQGTDLTTPGAYTAKIAANVAIAAIVNEVAPSSTSAKQSTSYNTFAVGAAILHLPLVESNGADGWSTGEGIMNTGSIATTVTVTYFDTSTGMAVGTADTKLLQPNAFWGLYQPAGGLPNGRRAIAVITTTGGGPVAVICNESNPTTFMSYIGQ